MIKKFPFYKQPDRMDCGPACIQMIVRYYGKSISLEKIRKLSETTRSGSNMLGLSNAAENLGFRSTGLKLNFEQLSLNTPFPCICFWDERHFVVVYAIRKNTVYVADPAHGLLTYSVNEFLEHWMGKNASQTEGEGFVLILEPTPKLSELEEEKTTLHREGFLSLWPYLKDAKKQLIQLAACLLVVSIIQLIFPLLTQSVVDTGIKNKDIHFLYLVLMAQLFLFLGRTFVEVIRSWISLHLSTRIRIALISDFLIKLMKLPISFFDVKMTGDIMQRIGDHQRIERILTRESLNILFSGFNFIVFGVILACYNTTVFFIFLIGTILYFFWVSFFMKKRSDLDHKRFSQLTDERSKMMELISGMQEIKLQNAEQQKREEWEQVQMQLYKLQAKGLRLEQLQSNGAAFINELKNILVSFYTAKLVIDGELTLGMMLSVSYIIGQLNAPVTQFLGFVFSLQDARISLERLAEIHRKDEEEPVGERLFDALPSDPSIVLKNVSFRYPGNDSPILKNLQLIIPANKTTAIVGTSGSGKTTLMKLLLRFYEPQQGTIHLGASEVSNFSHRFWRSNAGTVMQDGFIFSDTIARNIALGEDTVDPEKLKNAIRVANIQDFIDELPLGHDTKIGAEGMGISGGQKQRILIARAVYKNPSFLFFDEATASLDATNERIIQENLNTFMEGKTAVIIAHRLSTVKHADQIIVLDHGQIIERGTHSELISINGSYYDLVKNQLELDN